MDKLIEKLKDSSYLIVLAGWILAVIMTLMYRRSELKLSQCEDRISGPEVEVLEREYERTDSALVILRSERDSLLRIVEKADSVIAMYELSSINGKTKFYKDITNWRLLPTDQRVLFFAKELAKVDEVR